MKKKEKEFWENEVTKNNLIWPNEQVIRFVRHNASDMNKTILDFECGAGRNSIALASYGYNVIAVDCAEKAVRLVDEKAKTYNLCIKSIVNSDDIQVLVEDNSIDIIIADGSLFYKNYQDTIIILEDLKNTLVKDGIMWASWRADKDYLYGMGDEIEKDYFEMNKASGRLGARYHFFSEQVLREIYAKAGLNVVSIDTFQYTEMNGERNNSWYYVVAKK